MRLGARRCHGADREFGRAPGLALPGRRDGDLVAGSGDERRTGRVNGAGKSDETSGEPAVTGEHALQDLTVVDGG